MIFAIILLLLLGISVLMNFSHFMGGLSPITVSHNRLGGPRLDEVLTEDNDAPNNKIAVVDIDGIITSRALDQSGYNMVDVVKAQLKRAEEDDRVKAVILKVDSPGGEVLASDSISQGGLGFPNEAPRQAGGVLDGQPGRVWRLLRFRALPLDRGS